MKSTTANNINVLYRVRITLESEVLQAFVPMEKFTIGSTPSLPVVIKDKSVNAEHLPDFALGSFRLYD